jgi:hypothetical protein
VAKARRPSPAARREARAEFEAVCRAMLAGLREPVSRVYRRIVRAAPKADGPLCFVLWEWFGESDIGITISLEDGRPPFRGDLAGADATDWRGWDRRLGEDSWGYFRRVVVRVFGEWWVEAGGAGYPRPVVIGEHDVGDRVDLRPAEPANL